MTDKGHSITIRIALALQKCVGWKLIITPVGPRHQEEVETFDDPSLIKELARAFR
jgi:hypothetical protein